MQKLEDLKEHYETNFGNNNETSRKIAIIEDNISNYFLLQDFFNFKTQKVIILENFKIINLRKTLWMNY